ncbi:MAG: hydroxyisourate hydrolase [Zoogloeaceae bacterium]|nr:hydroxyisourate hydrolase [Zoogloeaceae bacterium]
MATITTHVLDTSAGRPAAGVRFCLERVAPDPCEVLARGATNIDGRCDGPVLQDAPIGTYELHFSVAAYFRGQGVVLSDPPFLDRVTLRFGIAEADGHYHVPLWMTPWSYGTYRGS